LNFGALFRTLFIKRYKKWQMRKASKFVFGFEGTMYRAWFAEMYCFALAQDKRKELESRGLMVYVDVGHTETFGLNRPDQVGIEQFKAAVREVMQAWDAGREECGFTPKEVIYPEAKGTKGRPPRTPLP
jgi:hypothetical protein